MRTGWADADFKQIKNTDHNKSPKILSALAYFIYGIGRFCEKYNRQPSLLVTIDRWARDTIYEGYKVNEH